MVNTAVTDIVCPAVTTEDPVGLLVEVVLELENFCLFSAVAITSFDTENRAFPVEYIKAASAAIEIENPMEAEKYLNSYRLEILETLRPMDSFSEDYIFYYGLKLKLLLRIRQFDANNGEKAYKNIYDSILNGDRLEAK